MSIVTTINQTSAYPILSNKLANSGCTPSTSATLKHFGNLYLRSHCFSQYPELMTSEGWAVDWLINGKLCLPAQLPRHVCFIFGFKLPQCMPKVTVWWSKQNHISCKKPDTLLIPTAPWDPIHECHKQDRRQGSSLVESNSHYAHVWLSAKNTDIKAQLNRSLSATHIAK